MLGSQLQSTWEIEKFSRSYQDAANPGWMWITQPIIVSVAGLNLSIYMKSTQKVLESFELTRQNVAALKLEVVVKDSTIGFRYVYNQVRLFSFISRSDRSFRSFREKSN